MFFSCSFVSMGIFWLLLKPFSWSRLFSLHIKDIKDTKKGLLVRLKNNAYYSIFVV